MRANRRHGGVPPSGMPPNGVPSNRSCKPRANDAWDCKTNAL
jgi:hypothetical protein